MDFKDLSILKKILVIIFLILISPLLLLIGLFIIIRIPFEYFIYKKSKYYKKYKEKYSFGITSTDSYKIINYFERIKYSNYSYNCENDELIIGKTTYIFPWFEFISYNDEGKCIVAEQDNDEPILLLEDSKMKDKDNTILLIQEKDIDEKDLKMAKNDKYLITYKNLSDLKRIIL